MIIHFFRFFFRNAMNKWSHTLINLIGLAIGLAASILILLYVFNELSFDKFHQNAINIQRVFLNYQQKENVFGTPTIPAAVGPSLVENFPEISSVCRMTNNEKGFFTYDGNFIEAEKIMYADSTFFKMFSFNLTEGSPGEVLSGLHRVILTPLLASTIFGDINPIGQIVQLNGDDSWIVSGISQSAPANSSIQFDAILSFETLYLDSTLHLNWNGGNQYLTYVKTIPNFNKEDFYVKLPSFLDEKINKQIESSGFRVDLKIEPIADVHLYSLMFRGDKRDIERLHIFLLIAFLILLIACFNFTSLATASAIRRARETGVRKVIGASRIQLILQYLSESILLSFIAFLIALLLVELVLPYYNALIGSSLTIYQTLPWFIPSILLLVLVTGIVAGAYPAFYLSSFRPVKVLKGGFETSRVRSIVPKILVLIQFVAAVILFNCSWIIFTQLQYIRNFDKGFRSDNVKAVVLPSGQAREKYEILEQVFKELPWVESCGAVSSLPGDGVDMNGYKPEGYDNPVMINVMDIDPSFLDIFDIQLVAGRNFEDGVLSDKKAYLVNETFVKQFGYDEPLGKVIQRDGNFPIIGVINDFHFETLYQPIKPLILTMHPYDGYSFLVIHTKLADNKQTSDEIEAAWRSVLPNDPFVIFDMDTFLHKTYDSESRFGTIISWFTALAFLIAGLGLFGLSSLIIRQRAKELGIRKVLGATSFNLIISTTFGFMLLVILANAIAAIPVWLVMTEWLNNFNYRTQLSPWMFLATAFVTIFIAGISIGWQSWKNTHINMAEIVKYE